MASYTGHRDEDVKADLYPSHFLTKFLLPLGTVLVAAVTFLTLKGTLSDKWAIGLIIAYFVTIVLTVINKPLIRVSKAYRDSVRRKKIAKHYYPWLMSTAKQFARLIDDRSDNLLYYLQDLVRNNYTQIDMEHIATIQLWFHAVEARLNTHENIDFKFTASELSRVISQYHRFCINVQRQVEQIIIQGKITEEHALRNVKQEWNLRRENHNQFINDLKDLVNNINESVGEKICVEYYESLKPLV